jgi:hypothetical protein
VLPNDGSTAQRDVDRAIIWNPASLELVCVQDCYSVHIAPFPDKRLRTKDLLDKAQRGNPIEYRHRQAFEILMWRVHQGAAHTVIHATSVVRTDVVLSSKGHAMPWIISLTSSLMAAGANVSA